MIKLIKTVSIPCIRCGSKDFKLINGAKICFGCANYVPRELIREPIKMRK